MAAAAHNMTEANKQTVILSRVFRRRISGKTSGLTCAVAAFIRRAWPKSQERAFSAHTSREILRPKPGLRMTVPWWPSPRLQLHPFDRLTLGLLTAHLPAH